MSGVFVLHGAACHAAPFWQGGRALTLPGHGDAPRTEATVEAFADAVAPELGARPVLMGHSLGGMVALTLAARLGEGLRALVLVETPIRLPLAPLHPLGVRIAPALARVPGPRLIAEAISRRTVNRAARPIIRDSIASMSADGLADAMRAAARFDGWPLLPRIACPVLAIWGRSSPLTTAAMARAVGKLPNATSLTYKGGHLVQFDQPERFRADVTAFLEAHP